MLGRLRRRQRKSSSIRPRSRIGLDRGESGFIAAERNQILRILGCRWVKHNPLGRLDWPSIFAHQPARGGSASMQSALAGAKWTRVLLSSSRVDSTATFILFSVVHTIHAAAVGQLIELLSGARQFKLLRSLVRSNITLAAAAVVALALANQKHNNGDDFEQFQ